MGITLIRKMIETGIAHERATNDLAKRLIEMGKQTGKNFTLEGTKGVIDLVINYINQVPHYIEKGLHTSGQFGIEYEMNQMINELIYYWRLEQDNIPDNLGLIGITDDAYASMYLLQTLSDHCEKMSGRPLLEVNFTSLNTFIGVILGETVVSVLQQQVHATINNTMRNQLVNNDIVNQLFNQVYQNIFTSGFTFGNAMSAFSSNYEIERQVDVQMGAMGIF